MCKRFFAILICLNAYGLCFSQAGTNIFGQTIPACSVTPQLGLSNCATTPPLVPYVEQSCFAGIDRILARACSMHKLSDQIRTPDASCDSNPYRDVDAYVNNIEMLVEMRSTFVFWAAHKWGNDNWLLPGNNCRFLESIRQTVCDINAAYDCAGVRRPIIQGTIYEHVDGPTITSIEQVPIPPAVIAAFTDDRAFKGNTTLRDNYFSGDSARTDKMFNHNNVVGVPSINPAINPPDVTLIEARMWMYYQAALFVDAGYTAIHMGDISQWGNNDRADDGTYNDTWYLVKKIRQYAISRGSFILLNTEPSLAIPSQIEINGQQHMIFDFNATPFHFREMTLPPLAPTGGDPCQWGIISTCNDPYPAEDITLFTTSPCNTFALPAIVDQCVINNYTELSGGVAPNPYDQTDTASHCQYAIGEVPSVMYFDLGNSIDPWAPAPNATDTTGAPICGGDGSTYGYDDTDWFSLMPPDCQIEFFRFYQCKIREMTGGNYYFPIPGILLIGPSWVPAGTPALWQLASTDNSDVLKGISDIVNQPVTTPIIDYSFNCDKFLEVSSECNGKKRYKYGPFEVFVKAHEFSVSNEDCSSIYTWHIKDPHGDWLPFFLKGSKVVLEVAESGTYKIYLRQDNMALNNNIGSTQFGPFEYYLEPTCCPGFRYACDETEKEKEQYHFDIELPSEKAYESIVIENISNNLTNLSINYSTNTISGTAESFLTESAEKDTFDAKVIATTIDLASDTFPILEIVERCAKSEDRNMSYKPDNTAKVHLPFLKIFPNPAKNNTTVEYKINAVEEDEWTLKIVSAIGNVQKEVSVQRGTSSMSFDLSNHISGVYTFLLCQNGSIKANKRLIIQN